MISKEANRRLTTILMADVVGYSRLMAADEEGTVARLKANRKELIIPKEKEYHGRTVKLMGDGALMEFGSVVDAVNFAIDVQRANKKRNLDVPQDQQISYRVGINIGDIIVDGEDIYGDGVNISARMESICEPDCIYLTEDAYHQAENKVDVAFEGLGKKNLKNIPEPVSVYRVLLDSVGTGNTAIINKKSPTGILRAVLIIAVIAAVSVAALLYSRQPHSPLDQATADKTSAPATEPAVTLPEAKPSIAVLPFDNMSGDPEQEYFSDGISEDIITDLSQISSLGVIARNSTFAYKGRSINVQEIGNELGAAYVLEGSVRKADDRVRITAQLIDASTGQHLWADRYDRRLIDIFELQDEIRLKIVSALSLKLVGDEEALLSRRVTSSFEAYDIFLKARPYYNEYTEKGLDQAIELYHQATELDPNFARAYGAMGASMARRVSVLETSLIDEHLEEAFDTVQQAVAIEPTSPQVQWALGLVYLYLGDLEKAAQAVEKSIALSPNYADGFGLLALINNNLGRGDQALRFIHKAKELNPKYSWEYLWNEGKAYYTVGEYEMAVESLLKALERNEFAMLPRLYLAASYLRVGQVDDAEWEISQAEIMNPNLSVSQLKRVQPLAKGDHRDRFFDDMRKAGLAE